jgi:hypothetical protein
MSPYWPKCAHMTLQLDIAATSSAGAAAGGQGQEGRESNQHTRLVPCCRCCCCQTAPPLTRPGQAPPPALPPAGPPPLAGGRGGAGPVAPLVCRWRTWLPAPPNRVWALRPLLLAPLWDSRRCSKGARSSDTVTSTAARQPDRGCREGQGTAPSVVGSGHGGHADAASASSAAALLDRA